MSDGEVVAHEMAIGRDSLIYEFIRPVKKSEAVARAIVRRIQREGMVPGDRLGVEPDLLREFGVGRGVFREAVRILERFGITETGRGKGGGLCVGRPHLHAVLPVMRRCFGDSCSGLSHATSISRDWRRDKNAALHWTSLHGGKPHRYSMATD